MNSSNRARDHLLVGVWMLGLTLALAALVALPAAASAATFSAASPAPASTVTLSPATVSVYAAAPAPIVGTPLLSVDGHAYPATLSWAVATPGYWGYDPDWDEDYWVPPVYDRTKGTVSSATGPLLDGSRVASVTLPGGAGSYSWSFTVAERPLIGAVAPLSGATVTTTTSPAITVKATDNSAVSTWLATIDGATVPATYDASTGTLSLTPGPLGNFASHTASVTVGDAAGNTSAKSWSFTISAPVTTFTSQSPAPGAVLTAGPVQAKVDVACTSNLRSDSTLAVRVDGVLDPMPAVLRPYPSDLKRATVITYAAALRTDGAHTVSVTIANTGGTSATTSWSYTVGVAPTLGTPVPAPGAVVATTTPVIEIPASDNSAVTSWTASVNGAPASSTYTGGKVRVALSSSLANDAEATVKVTVFDAQGLSKSTTWKFEVQTYPDMPSTVSDCASCHPGFEDDEDMSPWCDACHVLEPSHQGTPTQIHARADVSACKPCHVSSLTDEHFRRKDALGAALTCVTCHNSTDPKVVSAIASGDSSCSGCHAAGGHEEFHITTVSASCTGTGCHSGNNLFPIHLNSDSTPDCAICHASTVQAVKDAIAGHDKSCSACHSINDPHGDIDGFHVFPADKADCLASGCHDANGALPLAGKTVAEIHAEATTTSAGVIRASCWICHSGGVSLTANCTSAGCHPEKADPHGYPPERHVVDESCVQSCHAPLQGLTELKPVHDALATPVGCSGCHATKVAEIAPWDKTCTACHPIAELHPSAATSHVGTDAAYQDASFFGNGCSDTSGHTGQSNCHDISDLSKVHSRMAGNGCTVCHGDGKTPAQECLDCHQIGSATTYSKPGAVTSALATSYPSSDASITPSWTWTTNPGGQPRYAVVNSAYPPADTARYMTVTSASAGGVLFGFNRPSIPANAKIVSVQVYAKAKATNLTYPRKMNGWLSIGGQTYLSANQTGNLPSSGFLGGTGAGQAFTTSPTRVDYTREPLYGESIWLNPKTGTDWTPAQLNAPGPDSLDAFGVYLTQSTGANNVSLAQIYVRVSYYTMAEGTTFPTVGTHTYHENNVKYLHDSSDVPAGQRFAVNPAHGWYEALYYQDCYDFCHRGNYGDPIFSAAQGSWMWYSVGGDPYDGVAATRTLALRSITVPTDSPMLAFTTNYQLGSGAAGYVEISTNDGGSWAPLTGTVGGTAKSSLSGNASGWVPASYDLSAYAGQAAQLRFRYVNGSSTSAGWAFDSLTVSGSGGPIFSDDAETLKPDWANTYWTRAKGAFPY